jgi:tetratricopeptide (TPR) repeat protein
LQLDPNLQEAKEKLQVCLSQTKQLATTTPMRTGQIDASAAEKADIAKMDFAELLQKGYAALQAGRTAYALEALSRAVKVNPNDKNARQYLFDALLAAQQPELATTQLLAMEKIGGVTIDDEIAMVNAYIEVKANDAARTVIDHLIERYATDGDALLKIAQHCSDDWSFYDKGTKAAEIGMAHIKDPLLAAKLKSMHDVVAGKLAQKGAKPVETSIYKGGDGEANAPK